MVVPLRRMWPKAPTLLTAMTVCDRYPEDPNPSSVRLVRAVEQSKLTTLNDTGPIQHGGQGGDSEKFATKYRWE
jgi:hypothetical protein